MKHSLNGIAACVFDAYGTLFDLSSLFGGVRTTLGDKAEPLAELWRTKQLEYSWLRSLMGRHADFWHVVGESLDYAMARFDINDPALRARLMQAYLTPAAYADAKPTLERLHGSGLKLAILSNGSSTMLTSAVMSTGIETMLDAVLSVEGAGIFKPHPSVYRLATERFSLNPDQIAFVSANAWDAAGAAAFGFQVAWINRTGQKRENLPAGPDIEIARLADLPEFVNR
jgi:2-haloacid dehalogenase